MTDTPPSICPSTTALGGHLRDIVKYARGGTYDAFSYFVGVMQQRGRTLQDIEKLFRQHTDVQHKEFTQWTTSTTEKSP